MDANILMAAQKVLALSGALLAPGGEISLTSTILDTGLLVPVADKVNLSGVEVWAKLPLKTEKVANGLAVYLGKDGFLYAEDGRVIDPASHLYDLSGNDVGSFKDAGEAESLESANIGKTKFLALYDNVRIGGKSTSATGLAVKRGEEWRQVFVVIKGGIKINNWAQAATELVDADGKSLGAGDVVAAWDFKKNDIDHDAQVEFTGLISGGNFDVPPGLVFVGSGKFFVGNEKGFKDPKYGEVTDGNIIQGVRRFGVAGDFGFSLRVDGGKFFIVVDADADPNAKGVEVGQVFFDKIKKYGVLSTSLFIGEGTRVRVFKVGGRLYFKNSESGLAEVRGAREAGKLRTSNGVELDVIRREGGDLAINRTTRVINDVLTGGNESVKGLRDNDGNPLYQKVVDGGIHLSDANGRVLADGAGVEIVDLKNDGTTIERSEKGSIVNGKVSLADEEGALARLATSGFIPKTTGNQMYVTSQGREVERDGVGRLSRKDGQPLAAGETFVAIVQRGGKPYRIVVDVHGMPQMFGPGGDPELVKEVDVSGIRRAVDAWNADSNHHKRNAATEIREAQAQAGGVYHITDLAGNEKSVDANLNPTRDESKKAVNERLTKEIENAQKAGKWTLAEALKNVREGWTGHPVTDVAMVEKVKQQLEDLLSDKFNGHDVKLQLNRLVGLVNGAGELADAVNGKNDALAARLARLNQKQLGVKPSEELLNLAKMSAKERAEALKLLELSGVDQDGVLKALEHLETALPEQAKVQAVIDKEGRSSDASVNKQDDAAKQVIVAWMNGRDYATAGEATEDLAKRRAQYQVVAGIAKTTGAEVRALDEGVFVAVDKDGDVLGKGGKPLGLKVIEVPDPKNPGATKLIVTKGDKAQKPDDHGGFFNEDPNSPNQIALNLSKKAVNERLTKEIENAQKAGKWTLAEALKNVREGWTG
ncbi:hypothetical protein, partial [Burkholderia sp. RS02]|uniref:hypothetical protein n=1 Tax=unclassified Burkholderia TaxID=2613784 RepID=UPI00321859FE